MEAIILVISIGLMNILCFFVGARIVQKIVKQEKIEINPVKVINKAIEERKEIKAKETEDEYYKTIMHNLDVYDGTDTGQLKIPIGK